MAKPYSIDALNDLSLLTGLVIKFGGEFPLFSDQRRLWLRAKVHVIAASTTGPAVASELVEPTKDYFLDMAALAADLHKQLIKHADDHAASPSLNREPNLAEIAARIMPSEKIGGQNRH